jgi:hypothetical protein
VDLGRVEVEVLFLGVACIRLEMAAPMCYIVSVKKLSVKKRRLCLPMDFIEKAKIRLEHWITHNDHHQEEYEMFVDQLESAGKKESAEQIREMISLTSKSTACLRKALETLDT